MKKRVIALVLVLVLVLAAALAPSAFADASGSGDPGATPPNPVLPGGESGSESGASTTPNHEVRTDVHPAGETGSDSGSSSSGGAVSSYAPQKDYSSNPVVRFLNSIAGWFRQRFAPWVAGTALPWLNANWKSVAAVCGALLALRVVLAVTAKSRRRRRRERERKD